MSELRNEYDLRYNWMALLACLGAEFVERCLGTKINIDIDHGAELSANKALIMFGIVDTNENNEPSREEDIIFVEKALGEPLIAKRAGKKEAITPELIAQMNRVSDELKFDKMRIKRLYDVAECTVGKYVVNLLIKNNKGGIISAKRIR